MVSLEGRTEVASSLFHHLHLILVRPQEPKRPVTHATSYQNFKAPVLIQGFIRLMEVQECGMEDRLTHCDHILEQLTLKGGGPCPTSRMEPMKGVVVADRRGQRTVNDNSGGFPQEIH